ncbi:MAG: ATP-dependent Clp protease proteolytic subunit [Verrucomicrobia bacterium]|nr:ATP-dependent Clp protease proteolytic subunit [Verrucomicrobiota bacterium]
MIKASLTPYVIEDTGRGERSMDIYSRLLQDRIIFIGTGIDDQVANVVVAQLLFLKMEDPKKPIHLYINSPGGAVSSGLAIYDTLRWFPAPINTYCIGQAASMGALLLAAGTTGHRYSLPNGRVMIHQPLGGVTGSAADIKVQANEISRVKQNIASILASHTGKSLEQILKDSDRDFFMSAEEAKVYGIIDHVISSPEAVVGGERTKK